MPTPVSAARQCLTEEAARALDDAVAVARRRGHAQTTSLHAVSALLALPSSSLRDACTRAQSSAFSPRLQFRALELSVGVSLDRLPSSKALDEPPVSNSLMAAIKRSQANQRRHPESFHFHQNHVAQQQPTPVLRVELKHFVLSILDDPIVSRVFGEAGFRSCDIKLAIVHPPARQASPFARTRFPPIFLCNLTDSDPGRRNFSFPFTRHEDGDENSRRVGEVLTRKSGRNPLLIGVCASEALKSFAEGVSSGKAGLLPAEMAGLSLVCIEAAVSEFLAEEGSEEKLDMKFKEVDRTVEQCSGPGVVLNFGELKNLVTDGGLADRVSSVVSRLTSLLELHSGKLWLIGAAGNFEIYSKFLAQFPNIQKDWDLHLLPITSSKASTEGLYSKSSLMGSFVPFGGFFAAPSEMKNPFSSTNQCFTRCHACNEKYEQEVASVSKAGSSLSVTGRFSESLPSLQMAELDAGKGVDLMKTKDGGTTLNMELQKKWNEICQGLHHGQPYHKADVFQAGSQVTSVEGFQGASHRKESSGEDSIVNGMRSAFSSSCPPTYLQKNFHSKPSSLMTMASQTETVDHHSEKLAKVSDSRQIEMGNSCYSPNSLHDMNLPPDRTSSSSVTSVTTDLGLGTIFASTDKEAQCIKLQDHDVRPLHLPGYSCKFDAASENTSQQAIQPSSCSRSNFRGQCDPRDLKSLKRVLLEKVGWQDEAICAISQAVCFSRSSGGRQRGSNLRGDIWLTFLGPDKVGKKRIALALAEILYGSRDSLISVDLGSLDRGCQANSIFEYEDPDDYDFKFRGKTVVDYLTGELSRKHHAVVFLENIERSDLLVQNSLSQAIRTGKFPDSRGREISINNITFVGTTTIVKGKTSHHPENDPTKFSEEMILAAKRYQMQILIGGSVASNASHCQGMNVRVTPEDKTSNLSSVNKRKLNETSNSTEQTFESQQRAHKAPRSYLDLNVPVEEIEGTDDYGEYDSDSISESSEAWLEDFLDHVDEKVVLKPFDFDALAEKIVEDINKNFKRMLGPEVMLEIDYEVMLQILAAAWLSEEKRAVENWVEQVLCRGFAEAEHKYNLSGPRVIRLAASGPLTAKEETCVCLPSRINLN
ncbi:Butenolide signaling repressing protein-like [Trema orientale]|uniref:Butenolide signaling repressing protein-like n=1 Tax=Trema orientale TaxID=63057 RepID=A0A2P5EIW3_TREOI|nr:Butenolide signaling repressing protein-like [Trema orientale]